MAPTPAVSNYSKNNWKRSVANLYYSSLAGVGIELSRPSHNARLKPPLVSSLFKEQRSNIRQKCRMGFVFFNMVKKKAKKRPKHYEPKLAIKGNFDEVLKVAAKQADKKVKKKKN